MRVLNQGQKSLQFSTNFNFVSYDTDEGIFNVSLLDLDFCFEYLTVFLEF